ncbi:unnamed protein product [Amoebophrya sp. A25]|nr:unnamed protein product [Amoebophrya sp. A25]|eukprot:GSA25T00014880001.1
MQLRDLRIGEAFSDTGTALLTKEEIQPLGSSHYTDMESLDMAFGSFGIWDLENSDEWPEAKATIDKKIQHAKKSAGVLAFRMALAKMLEKGVVGQAGEQNTDPMISIDHAIAIDHTISITLASAENVVAEIFPNEFLEHLERLGLDLGSKDVMELLKKLWRVGSRKTCRGGVVSHSLLAQLCLTNYKSESSMQLFVNEERLFEKC